MASAPPDHYGILGLKYGATPEEIKKSYKKLALKHHPDHNPDDVDGAAKRFIQIQESYAVLTDEKAKAAFDALLEAKKQHQAKKDEMDKKRKAGVDALLAREEAAAKRKKQAEGDVTACLSRYQSEMARMREANAKILQEAEERRKKENERQVNVLLSQVDEKQKAQEASLELARTLKVTWAKKGSVDTTLLNLLFTPFGSVDRAVALKKSGLVVFQENVAAANAMQSVKEGKVGEGMELGLGVQWMPDPGTEGSGAGGGGEAANEGGVAAVPERRAEGGGAGEGGGEEAASGEAPAGRRAAEEGGGGAENGGAVGGFSSFSAGAAGESAVLQHRDYESLTMMRMRQMAERQRLAAEMDKEDAQ